VHATTVGKVVCQEIGFFDLLLQLVRKEEPHELLGADIEIFFRREGVQVSPSIQNVPLDTLELRQVGGSADNGIPKNQIFDREPLPYRLGRCDRAVAKRDQGNGLKSRRPS